MNAKAGLIWQWGVLDFAGGTVVHITSGVAGLVGAYLIGNRIGFGKEAMPPHNVTLTMIGAALLWTGWFGFNAGSALEANGTAALAFMNTYLATACAVLSWILGEAVFKGKPSMLGAASGAVAGLVAITPAAGNVGIPGAFVIGLAAGLVCLWGVSGLKKLLRADDSLDVFGVHAIGGILRAPLARVVHGPPPGGPRLGSHTGPAKGRFPRTAAAPLSFSGRQFFQQHEKLLPLVRAEARGDAPLVCRDRALEPRCQDAAGARQPQAVGAPVAAASALEQAARLECVQHAHHGGALKLHGLRQAALRHAGVGLDQEQQADAAGRDVAPVRRHARGKIAEHRLLRAAQAVTDEARQKSRLELQFVWTPNDRRHPSRGALRHANGHAQGLEFAFSEDRHGLRHFPADAAGAAGRRLEGAVSCVPHLLRCPQLCPAPERDGRRRPRAAVLLSQDRARVGAARRRRALPRQDVQLSLRDRAGGGAVERRPSHRCQARQ